MRRLLVAQWVSVKLDSMKVGERLFRLQFQTLLKLKVSIGIKSMGKGGEYASNEQTQNLYLNSSIIVNDSKDHGYSLLSQTVLFNCLCNIHYSMSLSNKITKNNMSIKITYKQREVA